MRTKSCMISSAQELMTETERFILTTSPSMDILISSNLERLIYRLTGENAEKCAELMQNLATEGKYNITDEMKAQLENFYANLHRQEERLLMHPPIR